jgi:hypothetical protein
LTPLRPEPYTALMPATSSSRHYNFNCRTFIICGVKLIPWICFGVLLPPALTDIPLGEFVDEFVDRREFVNRRDVLSLIFGTV